MKGGSFKLFALSCQLFNTFATELKGKWI